MIFFRQFPYNIIYYGFEELKEAIEKYIVYYNEKRIKEKLGWMSPIEYRLSTLAA
ncbi:MAG: IS3 family transposase [Lachnospiraceae bacterium]|nr:IS3 family transposase [Lachnospiraceae bacterium]